MVLGAEFAREHRINGNDGLDHRDEAVGCLLDGAGDEGWTAGTLTATTLKGPH